ncbi:MAG: response regulator [Flavobacteriales bacterium]
MNRILIIEDESLIADHLQEILEKAKYEIAGLASSADEAIEFLKQDQDIDMALLDIRLKGRMDGIELAHLLQSKFGTPFIYITAHSEESTMERLLYTHPSGYVLKPFNENQILAQLQIALNAVKQQNRPYDKLDEYLFIKYNHGFTRIKHTDILYVEANDNYTFMHTEEKKYLLPLTLKKLTQRLEHYGFIRIHRSYTVNPMNIESFRTGEVCIHGIDLPVSEKYRHSLENKLPTL